MNSTKDELRAKIASVIMFSAVIAIRKARPDLYNSKEVEKLIEPTVNELVALLEERERLARVDILKTILESYGKALYLPIRKVKAMLLALECTSGTY